MKLGGYIIPTEEIGDTWQLSGVIYDNGHQVITNLQLYVDEFVYRYNLRNAPVFPALIAQACLPAAGVGESRV